MANLQIEHIGNVEPSREISFKGVPFYRTLNKNSIKFIAKETDDLSPLAKANRGDVLLLGDKKFVLATRPMNHYQKKTMGRADPLDPAPKLSESIVIGAFL